MHGLIAVQLGIAAPAHQPQHVAPAGYPTAAEPADPAAPPFVPGPGSNVVPIRRRSSVLVRPVTDKGVEVDPYMDFLDTVPNIPATRENMPLLQKLVIEPRDNEARLPAPPAPAWRDGDADLGGDLEHDAWGRGGSRSVRSGPLTGGGSGV